MAISDGRMLVAPPTRVPLPYGLLTAAEPQEEADPHWQMGVRFRPVPCGPAGITLEPCPSVTGGPNLSPTAFGVDTRGAGTFSPYAFIDCSTVGFIEEAEQMATAMLTAGEARAVEREFWTGEFGTRPHLAANAAVTGSDGVIEQTAATVITGAPVDVVEGLSLLEDGLASCYGNQGVIHATAKTLTHLKSENLVERDGPRLRSPSGHLFAIGCGYPGTGPDGTLPAGGHHWMYATGAVSVRRGPIVLPAPQFAQITDRRKNDVVQVAYRTYVIGWDCCHFAVLVRLGGLVEGTVGTPT